jgi:hypothetical protein
MSATYTEEEFHASLELMELQPWLKAKKLEYRTLLNEYSTSQQRALLISLLRRTMYVTMAEYHEAFDQIREHIENVWQLDTQTTMFVSANADGRISSSHEALNNLRNTNWSSAIPKQRFVNKFVDAVDGCKNNWNLIVVDDFVGSGQTVQNAVKWLASKAQEDGKHVAIFIVTVSACLGGLQALAAGGASVFAKLSVPKAISDLLPAAERPAAVAVMTSIEDALQVRCADGVLQKYRFGWGQQEAVFYRDHGNTPNNVFPVFWWDKLKSGARSTVMRRR